MNWFRGQSPPKPPRPPPQIQLKIGFKAVAQKQEKFVMTNLEAEIKALAEMVERTKQSHVDLNTLSPNLQAYFKRQDTVQAAIANCAHEGVYLTAQQLAVCNGYVNGNITLDELDKNLQ